MLIDPNARDFLDRKYSQELKEDVDIKIFTRDIILRGENSEYTQFSKQLARELSQINNKIKTEYLSPADELAKKLKRILLSFDKYFYRSKRFKLHETEGIIIFLFLVDL